MGSAIVPGLLTTHSLTPALKSQAQVLLDFATLLKMEYLKCLHLPSQGRKPHSPVYAKNRCGVPSMEESWSGAGSGRTRGLPMTWLHVDSLLKSHLVAKGTLAASSLHPLPQL